MDKFFFNNIALLLLLVNPIYANNLIVTKAIYPNHDCIHPVHISYTNIEYNQEKNKFEILFKLFVDDFDLILKTKYGKSLNLSAGNWEKSYRDIVEAYILEHFRLVINGKDRTKHELKFVKRQINDNSIWLYYDYSSKGKFNSIEIFNSLMTDLYIDQNNLLIFTYFDLQKAIKLNQTKVKEIILL